MTKTTDANNEYWYIGSYTIRCPFDQSPRPFIVTLGNRSLGVFPSLKEAIMDVLLHQGWSHTSLKFWADEIINSIS